MEEKPKILLISDVQGWGGWERGTKIQEHLSDEFDIDLIDQYEFRDHIEGHSVFDANDVKYFQHHVNGMRRRINVNAFRDWVISGKGKEIRVRLKQNYDLYYLLFHIIIISQEAKKLLSQQKKVFAACTGYPVIRKNFLKALGSIEEFTALLKSCVAISANNMLSFNLAKKLHKNVFYIPRGVDPELFYPTRRYCDDRPFTVVFVGKEGSGKGLGRYIKPACKKAGARLLINERNYTNALSKDEMRDLYNEAHVYVVASETDGTPNPALESAACARPIIANKIGNMPEFIRNEWNGFIVERDIQQIADKLQWMKNHLNKAENMGRNARQTILDGWTWKHSMEYERKAIRGTLEL